MLKTNDAVKLGCRIGTDSPIIDKDSSKRSEKLAIHALLIAPFFFKVGVIKSMVESFHPSLMTRFEVCHTICQR